MIREPPPRALLDAWLRRAAIRAEAEQLYLRGSLMIDALCPGYRPPMDVDYLVGGSFRPDALEALVRELAPPDFDPARITSEIIFGDTEFPGLRVWIDPITIDFGFGDPLSTPPRSLDVPGVGPVLAIAPETLFGFKLQGLIEFGRGKWRAKDLADLHQMWTRVALDRALLRPAILLAFESRRMPLDALDDFRLRDTWGQSSGGQRKWRVFLRQLRAPLPDFVEVRRVVRGAIEEIFG